MRTEAIVLTTVLALTQTGCSDESEPSEPRAESPDASASSSPSDEPRKDAAAKLIGTWDYQFNRAERRAVLKDFSDLITDANEVTLRLAFVNKRKWWSGYLFDGELFLLEGVPEGDGGTYEVEGEQLVTSGGQGRARITYHWTLADNQLTLVAVEECSLYPGVEPSCTTDRSEMDPLMLSFTEHTYTRSGSDVTY